MKVRWRIGALVGTLALAAGAAVVVVAPTAVGAATTISPTTTADDGTVNSLRYALEEGASNGDTVVLQAGATYVLDRCAAPVSEPSAQITLGSGDIEIDAEVTIQGNGATIEQTCPGERVLYTEDELVLDGVTITGGTSTDGGAGGGGVRIDGEEGDFTLRNSSIVGNCTTHAGGGFKMNRDGDVHIYNSTIAHNSSNTVGGGFSHSHEGDVLMVNSTVTQNSSNDHGGVDVRGGDFMAVYSDIVNNSALVTTTNCGVGTTSLDQHEASADGDEVGPAAAVATANVFVFQNVDQHHQFNAFGTVVGLPQNGLNCLVVTVSTSYNFADDPSCHFTGPTDKEGTGSAFDPMLGALASNGGPTQTLLPQTGSPLINAIPLTSCNGGDSLAGFAVTTDQRGVARPQETGCEIGSVEVEAPPPVVIQPTFTG